MSDKQAYIARKGCGCMMAAIVDDSRLDPKKMAKIVSTWIEVGFTVDRMSVEELREGFTGCVCYDPKPETLPLFKSAGVNVDEPMSDMPSTDAAQPDSVTLTENAEGEKQVTIECTGEILPLAMAQAIVASPPEPGEEALHEQIAEAIGA
jgi:hypothetical protein